MKKMEKITCAACGKPSSFTAGEIAKRSFAYHGDPPTCICDKCAGSPDVLSMYRRVMIFTSEMMSGSFCAPSPSL